MYLKELRSQLFPVGQGSVRMNYEGTRHYLEQLSALGTVELTHATEQEQAIINASYVPSHTEMVAALAPHGRPDLIILSYWMPDLDTRVGNALVTTICAMFDAAATETMAVSENGPGVVFSALEYAEKAMRACQYEEVWVFSLNQFQGGSDREERIFWSEPGRGLWFRLLASAGDGLSPKISVCRAPAATHQAEPVDRSQSWLDICQSLTQLQQLPPGENWNYRHQHEYNQLVLDISAVFDKHPAKAL
ncbi:hypothetical protein [Rheinheimera maricola]|uniref:Uncharacterized protein n=1 Tax=Rheinheimera maricola TaxID=2793282 RepID=A0ABS7XEL2_9GAMM|nr:hypothetical protein [Rheinheimera maricola]MBZ9613138.1 hypothetical protein [Rheinheimera maricola]